MFKLNCTVSDDKLIAVLYGLNGMVTDLRIVPQETPALALATNLPAVIAAPQSVAKVPVRMSSIDKVTSELRHLVSPKKAFNVSQIKTATKRAGYAESSYSFFMKMLLSNKKVRKNSVRGWYNWA